MSKPRLISIAVLIVLALVVAALMPSRSETTWVDLITGSTKRESRVMGFRQASIVKTSALEWWVVRREGTRLPTWQFVSRTTYSIFGQPLSVTCREAPMYLLRAGGRNDRFVRGSTDDQIVAFVRLMRTGSASERWAATRLAYESASPER